jgi:hypothetical protein
LTECVFYGIDETLGECEQHVGIGDVMSQYTFELKNEFRQEVRLLTAIADAIVDTKIPYFTIRGANGGTGVNQVIVDAEDKAIRQLADKLGDRLRFSVESALRPYTPKPGC